MLTIIDPGPLAVLEDAGRAGYAHLGIPKSGPVDRGSHSLANALVGNSARAAAIEILLGPFEAETTRAGWIAVTGAAAAVTVGGVPAAQAEAIPVGVGERIRIERVSAGLRCYLAVSGGCVRRDAEGGVVGLMAGSVAWDSLSKLGTPPLAAGDRLDRPAHDGDAEAERRSEKRTADEESRARQEDSAAETGGPGEKLHRARRGSAPEHAINPEIVMPAEREFIPVMSGPRDDWFTRTARDEFFTREWVITSDTDRIAARLATDRAPLERARPGELASEGMVEGAVQITSDGTPIVFLADHPVTGGYPVIAVATREGIDRIAQAPPGTRIRFVYGR